MQPSVRLLVILVVLALGACTDGGGGVAAPTTTLVETTTTAPSETTTSAVEVPETTTTTTTIPPVDDSILAVIDGALTRVQLPDGETETIIEGFEEPAVFRSNLSELADGRIFYIEGWEDFWYSCEASAGRLGYVDPDEPALTWYSFGTSIDVSPDGASMVVVESRLCLPDPQEESWVVTPGNALFGHGDVSFEILLATDPEAPDFRTGLSWVAWEDADHLVVADLGGTVRRVPITAEHVEDGEILIEDLEGLPDLLVDGALWVHRFVDTTYAVVAVDLTTGEETIVHDGDDVVLLAPAPGGGLITAEYLGNVLTITRPGAEDVEVAVEGAITALGS